MIVIEAKLISAIDGREEVLGKLIIANDGTGSRTRASYNVWQGKRHQRDLREIHDKPTRRSRVENYPRQAMSPWCLVARALAGLGHK